MKPEFDKEIDALLRGHARGGGEASAADGESRGFVRDSLSGERAVARAAQLDAQAAHLDADELAAFAENALPAAARTRYAAHLTDCDDCRRTATRLALASGVAVARDASETVATEKVVAASWRERIAALLAPRAWRYAMPVVALLCVGVIALVVMRRVPRDELQLARNHEEAHADRASTVSQAEHHAASEIAQQPAQPSTQTNSYGANAPVVSSDDSRRAAASGGGQPAAQPVGAVAKNEIGAVSNSAPTAAAQQQRSDDFSPPPPASSAAASIPAATPAPQPPAPLLAATPTPAQEEERITITKEEPKPQKSIEMAEREQAQSKTKRGAGRRDSAEVSAPETRASNRTELRGRVIEHPESGTSGAASNKDQRKSAPSDRAKESDSLSDKSSNETRKVGGRKFRRESGAWIDTAYNSSQATVVVRRNSEQYRALVADEPEIARIANALGGEVVVVWKGRAYRIKP
jgi:hypothetical protein